MFNGFRYDKIIYQRKINNIQRRITMTNEEIEIKNEEIMNEMNTQIKEFLGDKTQKAVWSAYPYNENELIRNNLFDTAFVGKFKFTSDRTEFFGGPNSKDYESPIIRNPRWIDIFGFANESLDYTLDQHHIFFEWFYDRGTLKNSVRTMRMFFGS